jgi:hypothetical protein
MPIRIHPRRAHWPDRWPVPVLLAGSAGLWLLWPSGAYAPKPPLRLPEPHAAYVTLAPGVGPVLIRPDQFAHRSGFGIAGLVDSLRVAGPETVPDRPPPAYLDAAAQGPTPPLLPDRPLAPARAMAGVVAAPSFSSRPSPPHAFWQRASPPLAAVRFRFDPPALAESNRVSRARFFLELDDEGRVRYAVTDTDPAAPAVQALCRALERGSAIGAATGTVEAGWMP